MIDTSQQNQTSEFILLGLSDVTEIKMFIFLLLLMIYIVTLVGDIYIIALIIIDSNLHNPMYFFLANFSFADISLTSVIVPLFLVTLNLTIPKVSFAACLGQLYCFTISGNMEFLLLAVMSYDRYVAICNPLHYTQVMRKNVCGMLVAACFVIANVHGLLYTLMMSRVTFCSNQIHHFFCDFPPLLKLSCSDTFNFQLVEYTEGFSVFGSIFVFIVASYTKVISTILKMRSVEGRRKAFSTCSSHLTLVALFFSSVFFMYFRPPANYSVDYDRVVSLVYTVIVPMLNPFIYTLRNKDMTQALQKVLRQGKSEATLYKKSSGV